MMILFGILVIVNVSTKKAAKLTTEECEEIIDNIIQNKAISIIKKIDHLLLHLFYLFQFQ